MSGISDVGNKNALARVPRDVCRAMIAITSRASAAGAAAGARLGA
jgi:hypothetical protein